MGKSVLIPEQILTIQNYWTKRVFRWAAMGGLRVCETACTVKFATGTLCSINLGSRQTLHQRYNVNVNKLNYYKTGFTNYRHSSSLTEHRKFDTPIKQSEIMQIYNRLFLYRLIHDATEPSALRLTRIPRI